MPARIEERLRSAHAAFAQGRLAESRRQCRDLLAAAPRDPDILHLAAIVELQNRNPDGAIELIDRALREKPASAKQHQTRGQILKAAGRASEAIAAFGEAVRLAPDFPEAHASLGRALLEAGDAAAAREHLAHALRQRPEAADWHHSLALVQAQLSDLDGALASLDRALGLRPGFSHAHNTRGSVLFNQGRNADAVEAFSAALQTDPAMAEAHSNLGTALLAQGLADRAEVSFRAAIALNPAHSHPWNNLGNALRRLGRVAEAAEAFLRATQGKPALEAAWVNRGNMLREFDRIDEALECFDRALEIHGDSAEAHLSAAITHLLAGELEAGWSAYRWRRGAAPDDGLLEAIEREARKGGLIELRAEQGLGDVLFLLRWAAALKQSAVRLALRADARLFPLLAGSPLFEAFIDENDASPEGTLFVPLGDLPWLEKGRVPPYPPPFPLKAPQGACEAARALLARAGPAPYIGIAWRAGAAAPAGEERLSKYVAPGELGAALRSIPGTLVSLQRNSAPDEFAALASSAGREVLDRSALNADLQGMLALLDALDEYVGVSSTNVHMLAGLGKSARILVPSPPEWRYGRSGKGSPWLPEFQLYRESRANGWPEALADLERDLHRRHGSR